MTSSAEDDLNLLQDNASSTTTSPSSKFNNNQSKNSVACKSATGKRVRQRVDAGEPRNSYAAIPNFTSRLTNGYIVSSAGSKLISDLLARQRASSGDLPSMTVEMDGSNLSRNGIRTRRNLHLASSASVSASGQVLPALEALQSLQSMTAEEKSNLFVNGNDESTSDLILSQDDLVTVENSYLLRSILQNRKNFSEACDGRTSPTADDEEDAGGASSVTESDADDEDMNMVSGQDDSDNNNNHPDAGPSSSNQTGPGEIVGGNASPRRSRRHGNGRNHIPLRSSSTREQSSNPATVFGNMLGEAFLAAVSSAASANNSTLGGVGGGVGALHASESTVPSSTRCGNGNGNVTAAAGALRSDNETGNSSEKEEENFEAEEEKRVESRTDKMSVTTRPSNSQEAQSSGEGSTVSSRSNSPSATGGKSRDGVSKDNSSSLQEIKRARVETIVSNMHHVPGSLSAGRSPSTNGSNYPEQTVPVNGCKKRKLYQPIQHDSSKSDVNGTQFFNQEDELEDLIEDDLLDEDEEQIPEDVPIADPDEDEVVLAASLVKDAAKKRLDNKKELQRYSRLYESSPARSEELNSVEDQIKRDCDSDNVREIRAKAASPSSNFRPSSGSNRDRERDCLNLPNVYFVSSTPKNLNGPTTDDHPGHHHHKRKSEDRQSCIVKTSTAGGGSSSPSSRTPIGCPDLEWLVDSLKSELSSTLSTVIDSIVSKYAQRRSAAQKASSRHNHHSSHHNHKERSERLNNNNNTNHEVPSQPLPSQLEAQVPLNRHNEQQPPPCSLPVTMIGDLPLPPHHMSASHKEFNILSQMLDRKSPRTKVIDRGNRANGHGQSSGSSSQLRTSPYLPPDNKGPLYYPRNLKRPINPFLCVSPNASLPAGPRECHSPPTPPTSLLTAVSALGLAVHPHNQLQPQHPSPIAPPPLPPPASLPTSSSGGEFPEQTEAMSLVVAPKKKRQKVTDTRITPRTVSRLLVQEPEIPVSKYHQFLGSMVNFQEQVAALHHAATGGIAPPPLVPVSLPTSVAIPNPSLQQSDVFNPFHFDSAHRFGAGHFNNNNATTNNNNGPVTGHNSYLGSSLDHNSMEDDSMAHGGSPSIHSSMMGGPHGSPDSMNHYSGLGGGSFKQENGDGSDAGDSQTYDSGMAMLRKAKLMFFYVRYPSSAILKMYFPDIKFNKNNTAQLVKWFSNFREFYYIQMEKYARQAISDGVKNSEEIKVSSDAELIRVLNLHYNRNNHIEVPENFRYVVEQTLREFFKALLAGKDAEQSWKKAIYKVIARLDDGVPEYFKTPNFLEQLE